MQYINPFQLIKSLFHIIQSLDGRQGYAIGIFCADVSIILTQTESRIEILSDWTDMPYGWILMLVAPTAPSLTPLRSIPANSLQV